MQEPGPANTDAVNLDELPEDPGAARDLLMAELEKVRADFLELSATAVPREEADEYVDDLKRVAADFENFRKRSERDLLDNAARASQRVVENLLPVLDSFDLAVAQAPATDNEATLFKGVLGTRQQLMDTLAKEGLEPIPSVGELFDPEVHEAARVVEDAEPLVVVAEMRRGYRLGGRVIRAALVVVGGGSAESEAENR
ncbi:MAG: nucleotide exchange factor GrpE [Acidimicrobiia bacterium]